MEFRFVHILFFLSIHFYGFAQLIPNGDFEKWTKGSSGEIYLNNWETGGGPEFPLINQAIGYNSQFSICLNVDWDNFLKKYCGATLSNDFQITPPTRYSKITGYIKGTSGNTDTLLCTLKMFKGSELIGSGSKKLFKNSEAWEEFNIPVNYSNNKIPNKASITISIRTESGNHKLTTYYVDSLSFALSEN